MSSTNRWNWLVLPLILVAMLTLGVAWTGCSSDSGDPATSEDDAQDDDADDGTDGTDGTDDADDADTDDADTDDADTDDGDTTTDTPDTTTDTPDATTDTPDTTTDTPDTAAAVAVDSSKVSTFAPAEDLVGQMEGLIAGLEETLAAEEDFADSAEDIAKNGGTLAVVALALGLHDQDNKYKAAAGAVVQAAQSLTAAADYAAAKAALAAIKTAAASTEAAPGELKWEKTAALSGLMVKVPGLNTPLKSSLRSAKRFKDKAADLAGKSATLAVIAQASIGSVDETEKPDEAQQWETMCGQLRDAAAAYNAACHAEDFTAAKEANIVLQATCQACHDIFHTEEEH